MTDRRDHVFFDLLVFFPGFAARDRQKLVDLASVVDVVALSRLTHMDHRSVKLIPLGVVPIQEVGAHVDPGRNEPDDEGRPQACLPFEDAMIDAMARAIQPDPAGLLRTLGLERARHRARSKSRFQ